MNLRSKEQGFTLIELLLVVVIIGILLAVIVPRAWRANVDAKYGLVRQNASELSSFAQQWAEEQIEASDPQDSDATVADYFDTLSGDDNGRWVAATANWSEETGDDENPVVVDNVTGREPAAPEAVVQDLVPPERLPRNPFNGASVFISSNLPGEENPIPGALACGRADDGGFFYYGLVFQGTDSTTAGFESDETSFHAGQGVQDLANLRNGVFMARTTQAGGS